MLRKLFLALFVVAMLLVPLRVGAAGRPLSIRERLEHEHRMRIAAYANRLAHRIAALALYDEGLLTRIDARVIDMNAAGLNTFAVAAHAQTAHEEITAARTTLAHAISIGNEREPPECARRERPSDQGLGRAFGTYR